MLLGGFMRNSIFILLLFIGLLFQNCSGVKFSQIEPVASKVGAEDFSDNTEQGLCPLGEPDCEDHEQISLPIQNCTERQAVIQHPDLLEDPVVLRNIRDNFTEISKPVSSLIVTNLRGNLLVNHAANMSTTNIRGNILFSANEVGRISNTRGEIEGAANYVGSVLNTRGNITLTSVQLDRILNTRGSACLHTQNLDSITNIRGSVDVFRLTEGPGSIQTIQNMRGNLHIDGLNVLNIRNFRGNLIVENAIIENLQNFRGNITLINSQINNESNRRGTITVQ